MAKNILEEIVAHKKIEVEEQKKRVLPTDLYRRVEMMMDGPLELRSMKDSLQKSASGIIAEFKRKSPSKGWIKEEGKPEIIPPSYSKNGASAISILTNERYFGGQLDFIRVQFFAKSSLSMSISSLRRERWEQMQFC